MANLRVIYDNAADRATLSSSATVSTLPVTNLQSDLKYKVCRSTGKTLSVSATWSSAEQIAGVALAFTNMSPTATERIRLTNEPVVTNKFLYSEQFDNSGWIKTRVSVTANTTVAPDGTTTADTLQGDGTGAAYVYQGIGVIAGGAYPVSCFVKVGTYTGSFEIRDFTEAGSVALDMSAFTVSATGTFSNARVDTLPNGWYRLSAVVKPTTTSTHNIGLWNATSTNTVVVWGAMFASGSGSLTSYYPSTNTAATRPLGYIDSWQSYSYDATFNCCPGSAANLPGWTAVAASSAYAYGGGSYARAWIPRQSAVGMRIDITDTNNLQGYVEASRLIVGDYWEPTVVGVEIGSTNTVEDTSTHYRTDGGDLITYVGTKHKKQSLSLPSLDPTDRAAFWKILNGNGMSRSMFISLSPNNVDGDLEAANQLYGRLVSTPVMKTVYWKFNSATIEIEEV